MILIVDDDIAIQASLQLLLRENGFKVACASKQGEAFRALKEEKISLILMDMNFSSSTTGEDGLELLAEVKEYWPDIPVILITGWGSIDLAVKGMRGGAFDFIAKPWDNQRMLRSVNNALALKGKKKQAQRTRNKLDQQYDFSLVVGRDPKMLTILETITNVAPTTAPVLITGESGTGKEVIAETIHRNSDRQTGPFIAVNLGAIPPSLFESEMFGHQKGAFTDAKSDKPGKFELAQGGTLFLDEIGETDLSSQVKLLRVLQEQKVERIGDTKPRSIDVRIICATNRNLPQMVAEGTFREDLFFRINLINLELPPLRERTSDIADLSTFFLDKFGQQYGKKDLSLEQDALQYLKDLKFPGNIRELKNMLERTVLMSSTTQLSKADFLKQSGASIPTSSSDSLPEIGTMTLDEMEEAMVRKALDKYDNNITQAAKSLGLSRQMLYRRMEKYGLN
ncbi:sigma-54-dependent Fis family transcriptional regulator [Puteibacter caeruleilacunae]|nr:sigma-54-dependent Fis family transcriptional regulator [Puteibacter caeruleilacunae]